MMKASSPKSLPAIGFLTVSRDAEHGLFGGYLVLNSLGRPLEFHCTAPVRPNRAQEILYGPTLDPYLFGERIGRTLIDKSTATPTLVFTDVEPAMAARQFVSFPLALLLDSGMSEEISQVEGGSFGATTTRTLRLDAPHAPPAPKCLPLRRVEIESYHLAVMPDYPEDHDQLCQHLPRFVGQIELVEPFGRIREAIDEARKTRS